MKKENQPSVYLFNRYSKILFEKLTELGYVEVPIGDTLREFIDEKRLKIKNRMKSDNFNQSIWCYVNKKTGYMVVILTNIIVSAKRLTNGANYWSNIIEAASKDRAFTRVFRKSPARKKRSSLMKCLTDKLAAYAAFCKNIADNKPKNRKLVRLNGSDYLYVWQHIDDPDDQIPFDHLLYMGNLDPDAKHIVSSKESGIRKYFPETQPEVDAGRMERERTKRKRAF